MAVKINESTENFDALPDAAHVPARTVAAVIGMSQATVWRMAKAGKFDSEETWRTRHPLQCGGSPQADCCLIGGSNHVQKRQGPQPLQRCSPKDFRQSASYRKQPIDRLVQSRQAFTQPSAKARMAERNAEMSADKSYRASTLKRIRRTYDQLEQLDQQIIEVLQEDHPQSVRHVFYRMTDPRLPEPVEKSDRGYRHVQDRCVKLRRSGRVPYGWFADLSRRGYFVNTFSDASDFIERVRSLYRADLWQHADCRCEIWAESRSIASVLLTDCRELAVDLFPCGGFSSLSFVHDAAEAHNEIRDTRPLQVFYIGDYDAAGVLIDVSLEREMREHLRPDIELRFERIGINPDQIEAYDLPGKPRKETDKRALHITHSVEAEAMPSKLLRAIMREKIEALLPENALAVAKVAEQSERQHLTRMATSLRGEA